MEGRRLLRAVTAEVNQMKSTHSILLGSAFALACLHAADNDRATSLANGQGKVFQSHWS